MNQPEFEIRNSLQRHTVRGNVFHGLAAVRVQGADRSTQGPVGACARHVIRVEGGGWRVQYGGRSVMEGGGWGEKG